ncbi:MAG: ferrous iron transport protein B [Coriobacteriia bacterium]|nr:ferrous iron transport protein B [Coriobacteriia bacterium]
MSLTIALAGNPNSGKTTLFNVLTGLKQYVGNWAGVTVEKKEGFYRNNKDIKFIDLPGIYSMSSYSPEEVIARDVLLGKKGEIPDVIINVVDATNIERNLYLSLQLSELGLPMVIALNMYDQVEKNGDAIDIRELERRCHCPVVPISALHNRNIKELIDTAELRVHQNNNALPIGEYPPELEDALEKFAQLAKLENHPKKRWYTSKLLENDRQALSDLSLSAKQKEAVLELREKVEEAFDDDGEGIIINARYDYVTDLVADTYKSGIVGLTTSQKIDKVVTNRVLAIPIFILLMSAIYYIAISVVGGPVTDWVNEVLIAEIIQDNVRTWMEGARVAPWLTSLVVDGIIAGVGAPLGFLPQILTLFVLLAVLEDIGYMSRIAFILDRIFRRFGLSGKSFIPILLGTGCAVPGIMGTRTIANENDRRLTIMVAHFLPCSAKSSIIALFAGAVLATWWFAPLAYFSGILAVVITGVILKKFKAFRGESTPFVMELPSYHVPLVKNIIRSSFDRTKAFVVKAGTVIMLVVVALWFLQNITITGQFADFSESGADSILSSFGKAVAPLFAPLGFGNWIATVASFAGIAAKEVVVSTMGILSGVGELAETDPTALSLAASLFTPVSGLAFVIFNQLNTPCVACIAAYKSELADKKWISFALVYQAVFAYAISFLIFQFGTVLFEGTPFNMWTALALAVLALLIFLLVRPTPKDSTQHASLPEEEALVM